MSGKRGKGLSDEQIENIRLLKSNGVMPRFICDQLGIQVDTFKRFLDRDKPCKQLPPKIVIKNKVITGKMGIEIKRLVEGNSNIAIRDIPSSLVSKLGAETPIVSHSSVQRYMKSNHFENVKLLKKALIHPRNKEKRLIFSTEMAQKGQSCFDSIIWSDETAIYSRPKGKDITVWITTTDRRSLRVNGQVHSGGFIFAFCGCFIKKGLGHLSRSLGQ